MRHRVAGRKLNRTSSHRKALFSNMVVSLFNSGQIKTTLAKAKELRPIVEKLITQGKKGKLSNRKNVISKIYDKEILPLWRICNLWKKNKRILQKNRVGMLFKN